MSNTKPSQNQGLQVDQYIETTLNYIISVLRFLSISALNEIEKKIKEVKIERGDIPETDQAIYWKNKYNELREDYFNQGETIVLLKEANIKLKIENEKLKKSKSKEYKILQFENKNRAYRKDEFEQIKELFKSLGWKTQNKPVHNQLGYTCWKVTHTYYDDKMHPSAEKAGLWLSQDGWSIEKINHNGRNIKGEFAEYAEDNEQLYALFSDNGLEIAD